MSAVALEPAAESRATRGGPVAWQMGAAAVLLSCGLFMLLWWNRYLSPTVGGELFFAFMAEQGALPYRDYFLPMQPGLVFESVWLTALFGHKLIVFWLLG